MKKRTIIFFGLLWCIFCVPAFGFNGESVYTSKPNDPEAYYFTPENYAIDNQGNEDVSDALQAAINQVKKEKNFGILFIPEGKYLLRKTVHVPAAIRLIGYGKKRPEFILAEKTPGFQEGQNFMIWFTSNLVEEGEAPRDAGAGTFYSALSNINFQIHKGNEAAVAIRSHFAQHSFISHVDIHIEDGFAGVYDVGNEMENVRFFGGTYGIISSRTSPGWPMMMVDTYFEGQEKAAIYTKEAGLTIVNLFAKNVPTVVEMDKDKVDRLYIEDSYFENVTDAAIKVSVENNSFSQLNLQNVDCKHVPNLVHYLESGNAVAVDYQQYKVKDFTYGIVMNDMEDPSDYRQLQDIVPLDRFSNKFTRIIPSLPAMNGWVNLKDLGAKADGISDDTKVIQEAINRYDQIYVPQGWYRITETLKLRPETVLIGLHPFATQFVLQESESAFSGFGSPKAVVESSNGGRNILNGIGINTGAYNYRAVGLKWMAGADSYVNDVKFVGGHGTMQKPQKSQEHRSPRPHRNTISSPTNPVYERGLDQAWDNQYWSLWVTDGGGGIFKDIWTATTYVSNGFYVSHTSTPGRVYAMSLEHHVRNEARFENVSNWKMYAFQFEEEGREGKDAIMMDISNSDNLQFSNLWMYRVIRAKTPKEFGIRIWNSSNILFRNMHNYTQILPVIEVPVYDVNKRLPIYQWDFARLLVTGDEKGNQVLPEKPWEVVQLATGFEFAAGLTADSKGNVYFGEHRLKRIYKWSTDSNTLSILSDHPWKPFSLAMDTNDNLIVIFRYDPQPGYLIDGQQEKVAKLADDNPMYSSWGNSGWAALAYAVDPENPDATIAPLKRLPTKELSGVTQLVHPSSRWRGDFDAIVSSLAETSFIAPDGQTAIPETYDLGRSTSLTTVKIGQEEPVYIAKEDNKTTVRMKVDSKGALYNQEEFQSRGQYSNVVDQHGNVYIADGQIFVFNPEGEEIRRITMEERPISMVIGGVDKNILFVTTSKSLYALKIQ